MPSAFANYVGGRLVPVKEKGIKNWLDDIAISSKALEDQWGLLRETLECLRQRRLTVNLQKKHFCQSVMKFVVWTVEYQRVCSVVGKIRQVIFLVVIDY